MSRKTSQKRIEANRLNAQRSTGPRTDAGKAKSATNATTHGLSSVKRNPLTQQGHATGSDWCEPSAPSKAAAIYPPMRGIERLTW